MTSASESLRTVMSNVSGPESESPSEIFCGSTMVEVVSACGMSIMPAP